MKLIALLALATLVVGCSGGQHNDLQQYMTDIEAKPAGEIEPLPTFLSFKTFSYGAMTLRSPFDAPILFTANDSVSGKNKVQPPDESRKREYLENYNFAALSLVGTLSKDGQIWSLIDDGSGGIHRVTTGNYVGKNHGRITLVANAKIDVVEVVPDGKGEWVERPRTLALREKE